MHFLFADSLTESLQGYGGPSLIAIGGVLFVITAWIAFTFLSKKKRFDPDTDLDEKLAEYPPAPPAGTHRLQFEGRAVRIRLVVIAPAGRTTHLTPDMAEGLMETIVPGLGAAAQLDRPRIRVWPSQLSVQGFAPTFHRHVRVPEPKGKPSRFVLVAGPAKAGAKAILLGLALESEDRTMRGLVTMEPTQWPDRLRIQVVD